MAVRFKHSYRRRQRKVASPYLKRDSLLSRGELAFYRVLRRVLKGRFGISLKTRLADIVKCPEHLWETPHGRKLCQKHVDFVLYERTTAAVIAAVELDDSTHDTPERKRRDTFVNEVFESTGVILIRIKAASRYPTDILIEALKPIASNAGFPPSPRLSSYAPRNRVKVPPQRGPLPPGVPP
jgi:hypothetical protein